MLLEGMFIPVTTPFYADGACYWRKLEHNVVRYSRTPAAGMVVLGPRSEASGLSDEERRESLRVASEIAAKEKVLIAGAGAESVAGAVKIAEQAAEAKFDAVLLPAPLAWQRLMRGSRLRRLSCSSGPWRIGRRCQWCCGVMRRVVRLRSPWRWWGRWHRIRT